MMMMMRKDLVKVLKMSKSSTSLKAFFMKGLGVKK